MMRRPVCYLLPLAALILVLGVRPAAAQLVDEEAVGRLTIGGALGFQLTAMGDINDNLTVVNDFLNRELIRPMDKVHVGLLTGLDVRYRLGRTPPEDPAETASFMDRISLGFAWGAINTRSDVNVANATTRFYSRATTYYPYVLYHLPFIEPIAPRVQVYVGGGPIFLRAGYVEWSLYDHTSDDFNIDGDLAQLSGSGKASGSGTGFTLQGGASFQLNSRFSLAWDVGYRRAKMSNLTLDEAIGEEERFPVGGEDVVREPGDWAIIDFFLRDPNGSYDGRNRDECTDCTTTPYYGDGGPVEVDYSGAFSTISFRVHF